MVSTEEIQTDLQSKPCDSEPLSLETPPINFQPLPSHPSNPNSPNKENEHRCSICGKTFSRKDHLKRHSRKHTRDMFECTHCNRRFHDKSSLKEHLRVIHDNIKYNCGSCPIVICLEKIGVLGNCRCINILPL